MAFSFYDASVLTYLQTLDAVSGILTKSLAHCREHGLDPEEIVETRVFPDMHPFRFQVQSVVFHSQGAVEAIRSGALDRPGERPAHDYAGLQTLVDGARDALRTLPREEIDGRAGMDVTFRVPGREMLFTAEGFLMSFSLPNFYFHTATAYNILRSKGVPLGKLDYMGARRLKT